MAEILDVAAEPLLGAPAREQVDVPAVLGLGVAGAAVGLELDQEFVERVEQEHREPPRNGDFEDQGVAPARRHTRSFLRPQQGESAPPGKPECSSGEAKGKNRGTPP